MELKSYIQFHKFSILGYLTKFKNIVTFNLIVLGKDNFFFLYFIDQCNHVIEFNRRF